MAAQLGLGDVADQRDVRVAGARRGGAGQQRQWASVPCGAQRRRERGDLAAGGLQGAGELGFDDEQSAVGDTGVLVGRVADGPDQPFAGGQAGEDALRDRRVGGDQQLSDVVPGGALAGLCGVADQEHELVGVMAGGLDLEEGSAPCGGAEGDQQLGEDRDGVGLGVRRQPRDDLAERSVVGGPRGRRRPAGRDRQRQGGGRVGIVGGLVEQREGAHSAETSATAALAADSSTIALASANAATSDWTARLLISRGSPRETWWIRATASSLNSVSERPASAR